MQDSIARLGPKLWNLLNNTTRELPRKRFERVFGKYIPIFLDF